MKKFAYAALTSAAALALSACGSSEDANQDVMAEDTETLAEEAVTDPMATEAPIVDATAAVVDPAATATAMATAAPVQ
ncbi:MAG: hypothetical protein EOP93_19835 [Lysobacteraceae bacterium]|nr:MAG: hypothetical protein EOP93_19835 [Xanthomonadaceae bacterium]